MGSGPSLLCCTHFLFFDYYLFDAAGFSAIVF